MIPLLIQFEDLKPGDHALTDASSLLEPKQHADTLTDKLNPAIARNILSDTAGFDLGPSLNLIERWIVVDHLAADLIAVDSVNLGTAATKTFRYEPSELDRTTLDNSELAALRDAAFLEHLNERFRSDDLGDFTKAITELSISYTLIPRQVLARCVDILAEQQKP